MGSSHKDLVVWKKAMRLVFNTYQYTKRFPREETYGLAAQMRRAAVSIPSNIAEGKGRYSRKELLQFLVNARGSLLELETQIEIARHLDYLDEVAEHTELLYSVVVVLGHVHLIAFAVDGDALRARVQLGLDLVVLDLGDVLGLGHN